MKASAESKKPDISWHFAIVSFGSINIEGCVLGAALLWKIYFQVHDLSQIGSFGTCTRHKQEAESISHSDLSSALSFKKSKGFLMLAVCHNLCSRGSDCKHVEPASSNPFAWQTTGFWGHFLFWPYWTKIWKTDFSPLKCSVKRSMVPSILGWFSFVVARWAGHH